MSDLTALTATRLVAGYAAGDFSPVEVTRAALERAEAAQPRLNAFVRILGEAALEEARAAGAQRVFLEVRESNRAATALYARHGFQAAGRRENYYAAPAEAALILAQQMQA